MVDFQAAVSLHGFASADAARPQAEYTELLAPGVVHLDYDDPNHVFRVTVERVPRRHLPLGDAATCPHHVVSRISPAS